MSPLAIFTIGLVIALVLVLIRFYQMIEARENDELVFKQMQSDVEFYKRESIELNKSYTTYMDSVEALIAQHQKDLTEQIQLTNHWKNELVKIKVEAQAMIDDFSPESKVNTVLEQ